MALDAENQKQRGTMRNFRMDAGQQGNISDGSEPEDSGEMGSLAYTAGFSAMWQKDAQGAWVKLGGGTNG